MSDAGFATVNPSTGEEIEAFSFFTPGQTEKVVARADESFQSHRATPYYNNYLSKINDLAERTAVVLEPLEVRDPTT